MSHVESQTENPLFFIHTELQDNKKLAFELHPTPMFMQLRRRGLEMCPTKSYFHVIFIHIIQWPILLTWINLNRRMDKQ